MKTINIITLINKELHDNWGNLVNFQGIKVWVVWIWFQTFIKDSYGSNYCSWIHLNKEPKSIKLKDLKWSLLYEEWDKKEFSYNELKSNQNIRVNTKVIYFLQSSNGDLYALTASISSYTKNLKYISRNIYNLKFILKLEEWNYNNFSFKYISLVNVWNDFDILPDSKELFQNYIKNYNNKFEDKISEWSIWNPLYNEENQVTNEESDVFNFNDFINNSIVEEYIPNIKTINWIIYEVCDWQILTSDEAIEYEKHTYNNYFKEIT